MEKIRIEEIRPEEISDLLNLYASPDFDNGKILSVEQATDILKKMQGYPDYKIYVAKSENKIVGTFSLIILNNIHHMGGNTGLIEAVVVSEKYRSQGIGKMMMEFALEKCREKNCHKMNLSSNITRHRAHAFYEKLGFKKHGYSFLTEIG